MNTTERDPDGALYAGLELAGRYRLERPLGEGGMGVVWEARQLTTQKPVAIKVLKGNDASDAARFLREARLAASLQHRNIVQVFDFWEVDGTGPVFMVMELLRGETLASLLARAQRLALPDALSVLLPVASAIRAAHGEGVVHRDLKPENVFLARIGAAGSAHEDFEVKVLDFGLAKPIAATQQATALTHTGSVMGTPFYMAPEQVYGEKDIDARADIWAFGVLLYECLTGERPFTGENYGQVFRRIASGTYRPIREIAPEVPPAVEALVAQMLTHDRAQRPASIGDILDALANIGSAEPPRPFTAPATVRLASNPPPAEPASFTPHPSGPPGPPAATVLSAATSVRPAAPPRIPAGVVAAFGGLAVLGLLVATFVAVVALRTPSRTTTTKPSAVGVEVPMPVVPTAATPSLPSPAASASASASALNATTPSATTAPIPSATAAPSPQKAPKRAPREAPARDPLSGGRF